MDRRDFLKTVGALFVPLIIKPVYSLIPPRTPFVRISQGGLFGLYSHLGVVPCSRELNICEGRILDIEDWDGTGYPCLVENVCSSHPSRTYVYDFDLYNFRDYARVFRHDIKRGYALPIQSRVLCMADRFGKDAPIVAKAGKGSLGCYWDRHYADDFKHLLRFPELVKVRK